MTTRRAFFNQTLTATLAAFAVPSLLSTRARAFVVEDLIGLAQLAAQTGLTSAQVATTLQQVEALRRAALQLDPRSYQSVMDLLSGNGVDFLALTRDLRSMGYSVERVNARYRTLFPDEQAMRNMTPEQFKTAGKDMNDEIYSSALVAARAQTSLRNIEANNIEARNILGRSEGNDSQVAQIQSALQMLGLIHQNLVSITQTLSSAGRVTSNVAVTRVTHRRMAGERRERRRRDWTQPADIPEVDRRFLRD